MQVIGSKDAWILIFDMIRPRKYFMMIGGTPSLENDNVGRIIRVMACGLHDILGSNDNMYCN
jgi:hypothetical protein